MSVRRVTKRLCDIGGCNKDAAELSPCQLCGFDYCQGHASGLIIPVDGRLQAYEVCSLCVIGDHPGLKTREVVRRERLPAAVK